MNCKTVKHPGHYICRCMSPLGNIVMASDGSSLVGVWFEGQKYFGSTLSADAVVDNDRPEFKAARRWLDGFFTGSQPAEMPEITLTGTEFQKLVWRELLTIEWGRTVTYGELARRLGSSPRAVGTAVGRNPLSLLVPCHRVIGATSLTGYAGGLDKKRALLAIESRP